MFLNTVAVITWRQGQHQKCILAVKCTVFYKPPKEFRSGKSSHWHTGNWQKDWWSLISVFLIFPKQISQHCGLIKVYTVCHSFIHFLTKWAAFCGVHPAVHFLPLIPGTSPRGRGGGHPGQITSQCRTTLYTHSQFRITDIHVFGLCSSTEEDPRHQQNTQTPHKKGPRWQIWTQDLVAVRHQY